MKLAELIGEQAECAIEAIKWVESTLRPDCTCETTLDSMGLEDKLRLVRGLCGIIIMWSYARNGGDPYRSGKNELVISIRKEVEWEANANRQGLYVKYLASNILTASTGEEQEFYRQLRFLEQDEKGSLAIRKRTIERVIQELVTWFRYHTWNHTWRGYGQSGQDNVQSALEYVKRDMVNILEKEKHAGDTSRAWSDANN